jgi:hypothetical protein
MLRFSTISAMSQAYSAVLLKLSRSNLTAVSSLSSRARIEYLGIRKSFIGYVKEIDPSTLLVLDDLATFIEQASDVCADIADYVAMLAKEK